MPYVSGIIKFHIFKEHLGLHVSTIIEFDKTSLERLANGTKCDKKYYNNYRSSIVKHSKIYEIILEQKIINHKVDSGKADQHILTLRVFKSKTMSREREICLTFFDIEKAYN